MDVFHGCLARGDIKRRVSARLAAKDTHKKYGGAGKLCLDFTFHHKETIWTSSTNNSKTQKKMPFICKKSSLWPQEFVEFRFVGDDTE